jgi:hypothetical protein
VIDSAWGRDGRCERGDGGCNDEIEIGNDNEFVQDPGRASIEEGDDNGGSQADQTLPTPRPTPIKVKRLKLEVISTACGQEKGSKVLLLIKFLHVASSSRLRISKRYIHEHTLTSIIPPEARHISQELHPPLLSHADHQLPR